MAPTMVTEFTRASEVHTALIQHLSPIKYYETLPINDTVQRSDTYFQCNN